MTTDMRDWLTAWNKAADNDNPFASMGRSSYSLTDFLIYASDIVRALSELNKTHHVLDAGGGIGYISMLLSPQVKQVHLCDYSPQMIESARQKTAPFGNINCYTDDIGSLTNTQDLDLCFDKVFIGSVLQYFKHIDDIAIVLSTLSELCQPGARVLLSHNPDLRKKQQHLDSYQKLSWSADKIDQALIAEQQRLWLDIDMLQQQASEAGFSSSVETVINSQLFQSTHMFDLVLTK